MLRLSQNLLLGLLFLLQGMAPLIHAHPDGKVIRHGIHVDGLSEALLGVSDGQTTTRAREEESPGIGLATPKRNDERAPLPLVIVPVPRAQPTALTQVRWAAFPRATVVAHSPHALRPAPRAPPHTRLS